MLLRMSTTAAYILIHSRCVIYHLSSESETWTWTPWSRITMWSTGDLFNHYITHHLQQQLIIIYKLHYDGLSVLPHVTRVHKCVTGQSAINSAKNAMLWYYRSTRLATITPNKNRWWSSLLTAVLVFGPRQHDLISRKPRPLSPSHIKNRTLSWFSCSNVALSQRLIGVANSTPRI